MAKKNGLLKLWYVRWIDAAGPGTDSWRPLEDFEDFISADFTIEEVGFVVRETKRYIILAGGYGGDTEEDFEASFHRLLKVPKACIVKKVDLTKYIK